jgi:hypothetical protein
MRLKAIQKHILAKEAVSKAQRALAESGATVIEARSSPLSLSTAYSTSVVQIAKPLFQRCTTQARQ